MNTEEVHIGIDVSKDNLDISPCKGLPYRCANSRRAIGSLIRKLARLEATPVVCCEASGGYESLLVRMLLEAGITVARANAARVRSFARSRGLLAKTDPIDAATLAEFSRVNKPRPATPPPPWLELLAGLLTRRTELVDMRTQERNRLAIVSEPVLEKSIRAHIRHIEKLVTEIEARIDELLGEYPELRELSERLLAVKGIGKLSALSLLAFVPELGTVTGNQAAALVGVAPYNCDSGKMKGKRAIRGGRAKVRRAMYMAAQSARQHNAIIRDFYNHLMEKGKPHKVAIVAVIRKLVHLANRLLEDPDFQPAIS